jgi:hypothetical protein
VASAEKLLQIVTELKHSALLNDYSTITNEIMLQRQKYSKKSQEMESKLSQLQSELASALKEMEEEYYSPSLAAQSPPSTPPP